MPRASQCPVGTRFVPAREPELDRVRSGTNETRSPVRSSRRDPVGLTPKAARGLHLLRIRDLHLPALKLEPSCTNRAAFIDSVAARAGSP